MEMFRWWMGGFWRIMRALISLLPQMDGGGWVSGSVCVWRALLALMACWRVMGGLVAVKIAFG